jgi:hypothetical protein
VGRKMRVSSTSFTLAIFLSATSVQLSGKSSKTPLPEMWATLAARLDSESFKEGDLFRLQVAQSWVYGTCGVSEGALLEGRVASVSAWSTTKKVSEASVTFSALCQDGSREPLVLIAAFYRFEEARGQMDLYNAMPQGLGSGASGRQSTDLGRLPSPNSSPEPFSPAKYGEVKGLRHLTLQVGTGPHGSTVLSVTDKRLRLEKGTRLVLVPCPKNSTWLKELKIPY